MAQQTDVKCLFESLDSTDLERAKEIKSLLHENLSTNPRDTWLICGLIDYYLNNNSSRCIEILIEVREPHDKHVFDKLTDCLKNCSSRLAALSLLGQIICKQPSWLYKISSHALFSFLLKLLKTDIDIPILLTALLILVNLLPMIPALLPANLVNIFEIFVRLAAWNLQKSSNIPEIYVTHLHVGVYALFHRLYGMYPCNFLSHLRSHYGERVNLPVFSETIRPMLERVRMHPLLVTASRENELSMTRWKNMTMHDVIMECAKVSLDVVEGMQNESNYPYIYQSVPPPADECTISDKLRLKERLPNKPICDSFVSTALCEKESTSAGGSTISPLFLYQIKDSLVMEPSGMSDSQPSSPLRKLGTYVKFSPATEDSYVKKEMLIRSSACRMITFAEESSELEKSDMNAQSSSEKYSEIEENRSTIEDDKYDVDKEVSDIVGQGIVGSKAEICGLEDSGKEDQVPERLYQRSDSVIHDEAEGIQTVDLEECPNNSISKVVELVRKVNRLRYYSHCGPPPEIVEASPVQPVIQRSLSCPDIAGSSSLTSTPSVAESSHSPASSPQKVMSPEKKLSEGPLDSPILLKETRVPLVRTDSSDNQLEYHQLLVQALPPMASSCFFRCRHCRELGAVFFEMSPPECLHKHLFLSFGIQEKSQVSVLEDSSISRGQISMLYNQLLFERYRRRVYSERNRNLLAKLKKARALEEQNLAMRDQLKLQEKAIQDHVTNKALFVSEESQLLHDRSQSLVDLISQNRLLEGENNRLKIEDKELIYTLEKKDAEITILRKDWQTACAQRRAATLELDEMRVKLADSSKMQKELDRLQREVVLMGELQRKYRERLESLSNPSARNLETSYIMESYKNELQSTKRLLDIRNQQMEASKARVTELESQLSKKEDSLTEQKNMLQKTQEEYEERVQCLETRIKQSSTVLQEMMSYRVLDIADSAQPSPLPSPAGSSLISSGLATECKDWRSSLDIPATSVFDNVKDVETREYLKRHCSFSRPHQSST